MAQGALTWEGGILSCKYRFVIFRAVLTSHCVVKILENYLSGIYSFKNKKTFFKKIQNVLETEIFLFKDIKEKFLMHIFISWVSSKSMLFQNRL